MNPFDVLGLPLSFSLSSQDIDQAYAIAQQKYHPDTFIHASEEVRLNMQQRSAEINQAYTLLKKPLHRGKCLLECYGHWPVEPTASILEEAMNLREQAFEEEKSIFEERIFHLYQRVFQHFEVLCKEMQWPEAAYELLRLTYLEKIKSSF